MLGSAGLLLGGFGTDFVGANLLANVLPSYPLCEVSASSVDYDLSSSEFVGSPSIVTVEGQLMVSPGVTSPGFSFVSSLSSSLLRGLVRLFECKIAVLFRPFRWCNFNFMC